MSEAREKYVCFISYLCKKYILLSFHNTYVILFHINYWKFISGRGGSVNTLHKLKRNIALVIIFFMFEMCFAPYQTHSFLYTSISANSATFYSGSDKQTKKMQEIKYIVSLFPAFVFTRATSQSPCLHETLATAAITIRNLQSVFLIVIHV